MDKRGRDGLAEAYYYWAMPCFLPCDGRAPSISNLDLPPLRSELKGQKIEDFQMDLNLGGSSDGGLGKRYGSNAGFFDDEPANDPIDPVSKYAARRRGLRRRIEGRWHLRLETLLSGKVAPFRFNAEQMLKIVVEEHMSKEREKAINQVAESVTELADIFKEIQVLVIDQVHRFVISQRAYIEVIRVHLDALGSPHKSSHQGTVLDRIDFNIEQAADRVGAAVVELNKANDLLARDSDHVEIAFVAFGVHGCTRLNVGRLWCRLGSVKWRPSPSHIHSGKYKKGPEDSGLTPTTVKVLLPYSGPGTRYTSPRARVRVRGAWFGQACWIVALISLSFGVSRVAFAFKVVAGRYRFLSGSCAVPCEC
eukprot:scaffold79802_cov40-Tisochrysis_lutea.AAC.2